MPSSSSRARNFPSLTIVLLPSSSSLSLVYTRHIDPPTCAFSVVHAQRSSLFKMQLHTRGDDGDGAHTVRLVRSREIPVPRSWIVGLNCVAPAQQTHTPSVKSLPRRILVVSAVKCGTTFISHFLYHLR